MKLVLKPIPKEDYARFHELVNDFDVARMTATIPFPVTYEFVEKRLDDRRELEAKDGSIVERGIYNDQGELIGNAGHFPHESGGREIGYFIGRDFWGKGYATEAGKALINLVREQGHAGIIYGTVAKDNPASMRVLEKLGFIQVGEGSGTSAARPGEITKHNKYELAP
ncbi:GNAT family N-acetyltransferase [Kordiimonas sp. SCSIO 12603]|uniref:GNAT family N-acetyltransferase n=1 Tax=Kordiimonas sp. SCSIO 12603 TaxID=2829596 RepID=UPI0021079FCF|nr:GNAT family N-acetyltransferase [Kordiimonas sp. SCSIO 12603]UTW58362.1 GNAT family N-acetyltransferase [Kordiimonas sp. SCSIO 12603]